MEKKLTFNNVMTTIIAVAVGILAYFGKGSMEKLDRTYEAVIVMKPTVELKFMDLDAKIADLRLRMTALEKRVDDDERANLRGKP